MSTDRSAYSRGPLAAELLREQLCHMVLELQEEVQRLKRENAELRERFRGAWELLQDTPSQADANLKTKPGTAERAAAERLEQEWDAGERY